MHQTLFRSYTSPFAFQNELLAYEAIHSHCKVPITYKEYEERSQLCPLVNSTCEVMTIANLIDSRSRKLEIWSPLEKEKKNSRFPAFSPISTVSTVYFTPSPPLTPHPSHQSHADVHQISTPTPHRQSGRQSRLLLLLLCETIALSGESPDLPLFLSSSYPVRAS